MKISNIIVLTLSAYAFAAPLEEEKQKRTEIGGWIQLLSGKDLLRAVENEAVESVPMFFDIRKKLKDSGVSVGFFLCGYRKSAIGGPKSDISPYQMDHFPEDENNQESLERFPSDPKKITLLIEAQEMLRKYQSRTEGTFLSIENFYCRSKAWIGD